MKNTTFIINGGIGRVICSIPALEKYAKNNPKDDFKILISSWKEVFYSNKLLQDRVFDTDAKGAFENHIKLNNVVYPEPYHVHSFYNQQKNLIETFDEIINQTQDHSDLGSPNLFLNNFEIESARQVIQQMKMERNKSKFVVVQPYGSGCNILNGELIDTSNRSLNKHTYAKICQMLDNDCVILNASSGFLYDPTENTVSIDNFAPYIRSLFGFIFNCDLFIGCDSCGQHIANAFNKKSVVIMGGTSEVNYSYPDNKNFSIFRKKDRIPSYAPWRLTESEIDFANRNNDGIMQFTSKEQDQLLSLIKSKLNSNQNFLQNKTILKNNQSQKICNAS